MDKFQDLFEASSTFETIAPDSFILNAVILLVLSILLGFVYTRFSRSVSGRGRLASLFPLLALTTMMIITIIKSSIALSLGLVGALSIVRFRSAIKEPEELAYIFLTIALGLGMGAGQRNITIGFFAIMALFIVIRAFMQNKLKLVSGHAADRSLVSVEFDKKHKPSEVIAALEPLCTYLELRRFDVTNNTTALFSAEFASTHSLDTLISELKKIDSGVRVSLVNDQALFI